jgi:hypothetical protein
MANPARTGRGFRPKDTRREKRTLVWLKVAIDLICPAAKPNVSRKGAIHAA